VFVIARASAPIVVRTLSVKRSTVETTINASGTVQLKGQQTLKSPAEGAVERVWVKPGDRITPGQLLLTLRNPERQTALNDQQLKIEQQQVKLARDRQRITEAQQQLTLDRQRLQSLASLAVVGAIPRNQMQDQESKVRNTLVELRTAEADTRTSVLELESLQLERQRIQRQLDATTITSPIEGIVLGVDVQDGDGVELRTDLLTIGDPSEQLILLQLSTLDSAQVRVNQLARVSIIGPNPQIFIGRVQSIYPQAVISDADSVKGRSNNQSQQALVPTVVRLNEPTSHLIPGGQVNVEIVLQQHKNVIALNLEAVQSSDSNPYVWMLDNHNRVHREPVRLGLEGLTTVEVTSGLHINQRVVIPPPNSTLTPEQVVTPETDLKQ
jgi:HlyD family secretion protein